MARKPRNWFPRAKMHIISRGNRRSSLFRQADDYMHYLELLTQAQKEYPFNLYTYCLMPNHIHLQLETTEVHPSKFMRSINSNYARYFNQKYDLIGHVFQDRYNSILVKDVGHDMELTYYIHLNPVKAQLVTKPEEYPWSSYWVYLNNKKVPYLNKEPFLTYFPNFALYQEALKLRSETLDQRLITT